MALLVARRQQTSPDINPHVRLSEAVSNYFRPATVGGDAQHAAVMFAERGVLLSPLGDDELTSRGESKGCGKFTHIRGLRERIREQFVLVGFAVPVGVQQPSDPIFVEDE